ncbi:flagellar biosynthetic protein FliO [Siccirubricoccus phaeus]|uniref:flagellar biosynthetic protein FliO n=1 Tax=Siccirubricoccus phaeus TaxID=2595053 RepID=UPI0011F0EDD0|nr:flagellar biosynthetic protein FliO [Siccirubricoccus phaeus]
MLDTGPWLQAAAALAAVLGLIWLAARALAARQDAAARPGRRLALVESLALDPRRRLLLIRCDGRDALLLTGGTEDRMLGWLPPEQGP